MKKEKLKIALVASAGGHLTQLLKLADGWEGHEVFYVTTTEEVRGQLRAFGPVYVVGESNRQHPLKVLAVLGRCLWVIWREKPQVVISTGAAAGCLCCYLGKLRGARVLWIDSITNVEQMSLSGRLVRWIADLCLVQWPALERKYKNVFFAGPVI